MSSIIITPSDQKEFKFLLSLLEKLKISNRVLEEEELEDLGLVLAMKEVDRADKVSETDMIDFLKSKLKINKPRKVRGFFNQVHFRT